MSTAVKSIVERERKSKFVKLFDKTPDGVVCPHFYELVLSNGCPYNCSYCYLKLTFRGKTNPNLFNNPWVQIESEILQIPMGVFSTGELADSLAIQPPLLEPALDFFSQQKERYLLLLTKSANTSALLEREPSNQIIVSFSVNADEVAKKYEKGAPCPAKRLKAAEKLKKRGWRVRLRLDPIVLENDLDCYKEICEMIAQLKPELLTIGTLRQFPGLHRFSPEAPRKGMSKSPDGRMRYSVEQRVAVYKQIANWLGFQPALCKESKDIWKKLGWRFSNCNCTSMDGHYGKRKD